MLIFPAIDIKDGKCVRLVKGVASASTQYFDDPLDAARMWAEYPVKRVHVVDLDGAFSGRPENRRAIIRICEFLAARGIEMEVGGGIRDDEAIETYIEAGAARVILGTAAVKRPEWFARQAERFPGRLNLALDCRQGRVAVSGWTEDTALDAPALVERFRALPLGELIYTDTERDGTFAGVDTAGFTVLRESSPWPLVLSGGVGSLEDVKRAKEACAWALIIGKALYDGRIRLEKAIEAAR